MPEKLVSIIIPNYNSLPYIKETIESIYSQSYKNIEVIIVDDGSTDSSLDYLKKLSETKINLAVESNPKKGACSARNYGLKIAKGKYIQFLDADDVLSPKKVEIQVKALEAFGENKIAVCNTSHFYNTVKNGKIVDEDFMFSTDKPEDFLLKLYGGDGKNHNMVGQHAYLCSSNIIDKAGYWDEDLHKDQDGDFFARVVMKSKGVIFTPNVIAYYRKHINGTNIGNKKQEKHIKSQLKALKTKSLVLKQFENTNAYRNAMALQYKMIAINAFPDFKELSEYAMQKSNFYGGSMYMPVLGGKVVEFIKVVFGWKLAKKIKIFVNKIQRL